MPLSHLRSKDFTSVYFAYKSVAREISRYIPGHKAFDFEFQIASYVVSVITSWCSAVSKAEPID